MIDVIYFHQFVVQITISKNLIVDLQIGEIKCTNEFPKLGTFISMLDRFQIGFFYEYIYTQFRKTKPVLYFNQNIGADAIKRLYYTQCFYTKVYSMTDVIKDAFLMMCLRQSCLPVGFLRVCVLLFILTTDITSSCVSLGPDASELNTFVTFSKSITLFNGIPWSCYIVNLKNEMSYARHNL